jgi:CDP-diglyceride synthetase
MNGFFRVLSFVFLLTALLCFAALWWHDICHGFHYDAAHARKGSPPFIFIGLSFIAFQLSQKKQGLQQVKGLLLGAAFALWGTEQFIQPGLWLTILDDLVIGVFVADLGAIMCGQFLKKN